MTAMRTSRAGAVVAILTAALAALLGVVISLRIDLAQGSSATAPALSALVVVAFTAAGAVVASARPGNRIGWLLLAGGTLWALGNAGADAGYHGIVAAPGSVPGAAAWAVAGSAIRGLGWWVLVLGVPVLFPTGRVAGRRWRWLTALLAAVLLCATVGAVFTGDANLPELHWHNPIAALGMLPDLLSLAALALGVVVTAGTVVQLRARWHRGGALERQQLFLFALAVVPPVVVGPLSLAGLVGDWAFSAAVLPLPVTIGFAVLARGLYDLRTAANRTLVWLTLSGLLVAIYALIIGGVGELLHAGGAVWLPWLAAAVVALAFAPLRGAAQQAVNRMTFGRWDEPYAVLAALGRQVEATRDVDRLLADVVRELEDGFGLRDVGILDVRDRPISGAPTTAGEAIPLTAYGERLGTLRFRTPAPPLRARDRRLLGDLAGHLGGLLHAQGLTEELHQARERLVLAREEERRRLRRDLHDGLGPALAGQLLQLEVIAGLVADLPRTRTAVDVLMEDLRTTIADVRRVVEGLRPPALDELGLPGALRQATDRLVAGSGTELELAADGLPPLPAAVEVAAFRIVTEAVTNVARHAAATRCRVTLAVAGAVLNIEVRDDGRGTPAPGVGGHGLDTMRERAEELRGHLRVDGGRGTTVVAELPLPAPVAVAPEEPPVAVVAG